MQSRVHICQIFLWKQLINGYGSVGNDQELNQIQFIMFQFGVPTFKVDVLILELPYLYHLNFHQYIDTRWYGLAVNIPELVYNNLKKVV